MLVKPKEKEAGGLCRATTPALVNLSWRVLLVSYQGWSCNLLPGSVSFLPKHKSWYRGYAAPLVAAVNIFQLSAGWEAEPVEAQPRQSTEMLIEGGGAPFCSLLLLVSQADWPPTLLFRCTMPRKTSDVWPGGCFALCSLLFWMVDKTETSISFSGPGEQFTGSWAESN